MHTFTRSQLHVTNPRLMHMGLLFFFTLVKGRRWRNLFVHQLITIQKNKRRNERNNNQNKYFRVWCYVLESLVPFYGLHLNMIILVTWQCFGRFEAFLVVQSLPTQQLASSTKSLFLFIIADVAFFRSFGSILLTRIPS